MLAKHFRMKPPGSFSQRTGIKPMRKAIQLKGLDLETRNRLWTIFKIGAWDYWSHDHRYKRDAGSIEDLLEQLWFRYFKRPADERPEMHGRGRESCYDILRNYFFSCSWNELFDFSEFVIHRLPDDLANPLVTALNEVLEEENSAYRIVGYHFAELTNENEIAEIDMAANSGLEGVSLHIVAAVKFLSDRKSPDYRNSIKESISAIEALFKVLTKSKSATFPEGLKRIKSVIALHPALLAGFEKLYAYTSDHDGIRHAIFETPSSSSSDAKYMLVSCSAFINYVIGKYVEAGRKI